MSNGDHDPEVVRVARDVRARRLEPAAFDMAFGRATIYARRSTSERPGIMVSRLPGKGPWVLAFSTLERLIAFDHDAAWFSMSGADLLAQLPARIGVLLDVGEDHGLPLLPQPAGPARFADAFLPEPDAGGRSLTD